MHVACGFRVSRGDGCRQLLHERDHDVAVSRRCCYEFGTIKIAGAGGRLNVGETGCRDDANFSLCNRERHLDIEQRLKMLVIAGRRHQKSKNTVSLSPCTTTSNAYSPCE